MFEMVMVLPVICNTLIGFTNISDKINTKILQPWRKKVLQFLLVQFTWRSEEFIRSDSQFTRMY